MNIKPLHILKGCVGEEKIGKVKMNLMKICLIHSHPAYSLISWVGNPGDHRGLWEKARTLGVMSYVGDRPSSPSLIW